MSTLNTDAMLNIATFMQPSQAVALTHANKDLHENSDRLIEDLYSQVFGQLNKAIIPDKKTLERLLCCGEKQPDVTVNHNSYQVPSSRLERWKWIVGVENNLDKEVQRTYNRNILLLENSQACSVIQLKNQMQGFWHSDRLIKDYAQFKLDEQAHAKSGLIKKIFFACLGYFFKKYYRPSMLAIGEDLESRSKKTFATVGGFNLDGKEYDVTAFQILSDERTEDRYAIYENDTDRTFNSSGKTYIGIFEKNQHHTLLSLGHYGTNSNFTIQIGRREADGYSREISGESSGHHGKAAVLNNQRYLVVGKDLEYRGSTNNVQGSNRLLDQKLTQIMVEMAMQNKQIISLQAGSCHDDLTVLTAGGFKSNRDKKIMEELNTFRSEDENKLFPPYMDYGAVDASFETTNLTQQNVFYSKGAPESWANIVQKNPILKPGSGILPEYWAKKPNLV